MSKKVLFIATVLRGHILVFHLPYMKWFQEQGYEVHLCCRNDTEEASPVIPWCDRFIELPFERQPLNKANIQVAKALKQLIDQEGYDLIHCNTPVGGLLGRWCARQARKHGTKVVYTAHGFHFYKGAPMKNWLLYYPAEWLCARWTDLLITINQEDAARAARMPAASTALVHGVGVDLSRFEHPKDRSLVRQQLGLAEDAPVVITVGEHSWRKNHETMLRAMTTVPKAHLLFCGVGSWEKSLRNLAEELGVAERCHFLGFRKDIPDLLAASDVFLFTSYQEGLPVALMEAMAAGLPCVASHVRGNADLLLESKNGHLHAPEDAAGFADDLRALLQDAQLRRTLGDQNRQIMQKYRLEAVVAEVSSLYQKLLGI